MKYERKRNQFKSNILGNNAIILFVIFCLAICCIWSTFKIFDNEVVYAEETESLTTPQILNFNQVFLNTNLNNQTYAGITITRQQFQATLNGTATTTDWLNLTLSLTNGHIYYYRNNFDFTTNYSGVRIEGTSTQAFYTNDFILNIADTTTYFGYYFYNGRTYNNLLIKPILIDLTLMYGENIPTIEECRQIFTSDYYNYTTGTPVNANYFSNYLDAYNDIMESYKYSLSTTALSNYTFSYDYNGDESYFEYRDDGNHTWYFLNTFAVPLFTKINANAQVTINYYFYAPNFTLDYYLNVMAYDSNGNLTTIYTETTPIDTGNAQVTTFSVPYDVDVLFFNCRYNNNIITSANFMLFNFELSANQLDLTTLAFNAQESAREYYERYYGVGGQGYNNIYNAGYGAGSESQKPFTDTWDFIGQSFHGVGEILAMQLIPGLPLGLFVALPLLVGLLFFIVKIAKGSGG